MLIPKMIKLTPYNPRDGELHINIHELSEIKGSKATGYAIWLKNGNSHKIQETPEHLYKILDSLSKSKQSNNPS